MKAPMSMGLLRPALLFALLATAGVLPPPRVAGALAHDRGYDRPRPRGPLGELDRAARFTRNA